MSKVTDRRRNNRPPEHGKIRPGEVRNPHGARGKPMDLVPNAVDRLYIKEAGRIVCQDENGPVNAVHRLVQEEFVDALTKKDSAARARVLERVSLAAERAEHECNSILLDIIARKAKVEELFYHARKSRRPPPDIVPHPAHITITPDQILITGPTEPKFRLAWEKLKCLIKIAACGHDVYRRAYRERPTRKRLEALKVWEAHRRRLMRRVPMGWDWAEDIWCCESQTDSANELISMLRTIGYVDADADD